MSGNKILLSELIKSVPRDTEERVKRAKDRYNNAIRDAMRRNMRAKPYQTPVIELARKLMRKRIHNVNWIVPLPYYRNFS